MYRLGHEISSRCRFSRNIGGSDSESGALRKDRGMRSIGNLPNGCSKWINLSPEIDFPLLATFEPDGRRSAMSDFAGRDEFRIPGRGPIKIGLTTPRFALM
jgi:hypothetical protein